MPAQAAFLYPFLGHADHDDGATDRRRRRHRFVSKARDDERLRERGRGAAGRARSPRPRRAIHARVAARRHADPLRQRRIGDRRQRLGARLRCAARRAIGPIPAISLAMEPANITAIANDVGTDVIFLRQLIAHARPDDVAVAISTSGGSRNVIGWRWRRREQRGLLTVALLGYDGGEIARRGLADFSIVVGSDYIPRIQEVQASVYHVMRECWRRSTDSRRRRSSSCTAAPAARSRAKLREWLEWRREPFVEYDVEQDRDGAGAASRARRRRGPCRCSSKTAAWCRSAGRAAAAWSALEPSDDGRAPGPSACAASCRASASGRSCSASRARTRSPAGC